MPNWGDIASKIAQGMYGDDWRKARAEEQEMTMAKDRMGLAKNADARAAAGEARQSDEFEFSKGQRPLLMQQLKQKVDAGEMDIKEAKNKLAIFDATGGAGGAAQRLDEERLLKQRAAGRQDEELGLSRERLGLERQSQKRADEAAALSAQYQRETMEPRVDAAFDTGDQAFLNDLQQRHAAAMRAGETESAQEIEGQYELARAEMLKRRAVRGVQKETVARVKNK